MAFLNNPSTDLSRYSIGEIAGLSGVANFYNAGSSKWLRSGVSTASSNLSTTTKTNLAAAGTATQPTVLAQSSLSSSYNSSGFHATYPIARISASSVSVVPGTVFTTDVVVGVATSAGLQTVYTGQTSLRTSAQGGSNVCIASNNTKIFSYCFTSNTALNVRSTTNGTTWTAETVTGIPTFATATTTQSHASSSQTNSKTAAFTTGWRRNKTTSSEFAVFFCGARFLLIAPGVSTTNHVASLSSDGFTFGGDNSVAVLGSAAIVVAEAIQFYRNGNNCYLQVGPANKRFSTDGGVTWAASTFAASPDPIDYILQYNTTDPAKLVIKTGLSQTTAYYTADSGATWSANRALPMSDTNGGLYYKGSTLIVSDSAGTNKVSTNDGVTWANPTFPIGLLSTSLSVFADGNRFYAGALSQPQLLTSSDAVTWTLISLSQNFNIGILTTETGCGIITYAGDSNTIVLLGYNTASGINQAIYSLDGGVTWTGSQFTVANVNNYWGVGNCFTTPDAGGVAFPFGMSGVNSGENTNVLKADITAGGAFYRTGTSAITPVQANSFAYVRVG